MDIDVIYEDENLVALNKPAGILVHPDSKGTDEAVTDWLRVNFPEVVSVGDKPEERPGIVHRLDKDTSGVILIPRNQEYFLYLKELFKTRKIQKTYRALVKGTPKEKEGIIDKDISLKPGTVKRTVHGGKMTKPALTEYKVLEELDDAALVEVSPKTGRTHQIRVHLASIGTPVMGDRLYGGKNMDKDIPRQMLHAYALELELSPGKAVKLIADYPEDFKETLEKLEK